jgi:hypothetical protein
MRVAEIFQLLKAKGYTDIRLHDVNSSLSLQKKRGILINLEKGFYAYIDSATRLRQLSDAAICKEG